MYSRRPIANLESIVQRAKEKQAAQVPWTRQPHVMASFSKALIEGEDSFIVKDRRFRIEYHGSRVRYSPEIGLVPTGWITVESYLRSAKNVQTFG